jgi:hypothetical protein
MSEQRHRIKRQIIELHTPNPEQAWRLQAEVSRVYHQRLLPLIDQLCSELSTPDQLYRIDTLTVELGPIDPHRLEEELVTRLAPALRTALASQINEQRHRDRHGQTSQATAQVELLAGFARSGSLPWWADATQPQLLDESLRSLLDAAPDRLRRLLRQLAHEQRPLRRLVNHWADDVLARLTRWLVPALAGSGVAEPQAVAGLLQASATPAGSSPSERRQTAWYHLLYVASLGGAEYATAGAYYQAVVRRVAAGLGAPVATLLADLDRTTAAGEEQPLGQPAAPGRTADAATGATAERSQPAAPRPGETPMADLVRALRALAAWLPAAVQAPWQYTLDELGGQGERPAVPAEAGRQLARLFQTALAGPGLHPVVRQGLAAMLGERAELLAPNAERSPESVLAQLAEEVTALLHTLGHERAGEIPTPVTVGEPGPELHAGAGDEYYIGNAGLVILWPFLGHFFARLGLLAERAFRDGAAVQRGVGLLQHLATGEALFPEYLLPLNKVLCGMELAELFDFGPPLTATETEECSELLRAVVAQAPILREMSAPGLRNTFLLRQGVLRVRDGAWLLQVERQTFDVVLDRFPWSWQWVKLPWMAAPLQVEW